MLIATFQWHEVEPFHGNTLKRITKRRKGYLTDTGSVCAALRISSPAALLDHPSLGAIFETAVVGEIRRLISVLPSKPLMHHWRTQAGAEVDLLLERDGTFYPIEIKATAQPRARDASGIAAFRATYPNLRIAPGLVLSPTESVTRLSNDCVGLPWDLAPVRSQP
jgi:hypothetical protein